MALFDTITNKVTVQAGASSAGADPIGSGDNITTAGGFRVDVSFLDALYAGGKLSAAQRDAILTGSDVTSFGLSQYDLYYLTVGRLGSRTAPTAALGIIALWLSTTTYSAGQIVSFQPPGTQRQALYQASASGGGPAGTPPTNTTFWTALTDPGPVVLFDGDVTNPALAAVAAAGAGIPSLQKTDGTALAAIVVPAGRRYRIWVSQVRPVTPGQAAPNDSAVLVDFSPSEAIASDGTNNVNLTLTPRWRQLSSANNAAIAAVAVGALSVRLRVEQV
jgi:hypothetical protein